MIIYRNNTNNSYGDNKYDTISFCYRSNINSNSNINSQSNNDNEIDKTNIKHKLNKLDILINYGIILFKRR